MLAYHSTIAFTGSRVRLHFVFVGVERGLPNIVHGVSGCNRRIAVVRRLPMIARCSFGRLLCHAPSDTLPHSHGNTLAVDVFCQFQRTHQGPPGKIKAHTKHCLHLVNRTRETVLYPIGDRNRIYDDLFSGTRARVAPSTPL